MPFRLYQCVSRFRRDQRGNIAVIFGIAVIPLISAIGCAVDYSLATRMKAKLQSAADAAGIASLSQKSPGYIAASAMTGNGSVDAGVTDANNVFDGNINGVTGYQNLIRTSTVTKTGIKLASSVQFSADVPVLFMKALGYQKLTVTGISNSAATLPPYLDFYLALDVSGSMGLPSTQGEQDRLSKISPDDFVDYSTGCTLACHFTAQSNGCNDPTIPAKLLKSQSGYPVNNYCLGYIISRVSQAGYKSLLTKNTNYPKQQQLPTGIVSGLPNSLFAPTSAGGAGLIATSNCPTDNTDACIQLRLDAVGYAVTQLFITANAEMKVPQQFRVGLYPFITDLYEYFKLTSSINGDPKNSSTINYAAANLATLLDTNTNTSLGSGGTHIDNALTEMSTTIKTVGDGSSSTNTQPYVFLVTDGAVDPQMKAIGGNWSGSNHATTLDLQNTLTSITSCTALKSRGIIVSVLYIPYQQINPVNTSFAGNEDTYANNNIQYISDSLQKCASPGFFYTANAPADITASLNAMFYHAVAVAHITN